MVPILETVRLGHHFLTRYACLEVLDSIDLRIYPGQWVTVKGPSGSGKSTLLLDSGGMQLPTSGQVFIDGIDVYAASMQVRNNLRGTKIGYLFQTLELIPYLTVLQNVQMVTNCDHEMAKTLLQRLGLADRMAHKPNCLSHGQRQRVALARAMVKIPSLLVADEPTGNLDLETSQLVYEILKQYVEEGGALLLATHDPLADGFSDRILEIKNSRLLQWGEATQSVPKHDLVDGEGM